MGVSTAAAQATSSWLRTAWVYVYTGSGRVASYNSKYKQQYSILTAFMSKLLVGSFLRRSVLIPSLAVLITSSWL